ncbi:MAG: FecR domain-containing protein [Bacteroidota bacterium]
MEEAGKYRDQLDHTPTGKVDGDPMSEFLEQAGKVEVNTAAKSKSWENISSQIREEEEAEGKVRPLWIVSGVAASIVVLIAMTWVFLVDNSTSVEVMANAGDHVVHELPDGSAVTLNALSSIQYSEDWDRVVALEGEAFFDVVEGGTFVVATPRGSVSVLGTSFNVRSRGAVFEVACKTGRVEVAVNDHPIGVQISAGEMVAFNGEELTKGARSENEVGNWMEGEFYFSDKTVSEVFAEVERQYDTQIAITNGDTLKFTGYFFKESSLEETMELICTPIGLTFEQVDGEIIVGIR